ncbi:MAG TPA: CoA pyrophosphatase [Bryobacteraceae bacterium]|nr:CoA pyrophosphatase [Bryobacteraceae bacterium]
MPEPEAAVAIVHAPRPEPAGGGEHEESVLLIRRTERENDPWSGHWSFPGGRREPEDEDLVETALRELAEECGIVLGRDSLERCLPLTAAGRRVGRLMHVAPFLFRAPVELPTMLDPEEAAEALWLPLAWFRDPARHWFTPVPRVSPERIFPAMELGGVPLWGFTYRVLTEFLGLHEACESAEKPGFRAACSLLEFLLANGLELRRSWQDRVAVVGGKIPVAEVLNRLGRPGPEIPEVHSVEVRPEAIRLVGLDLEEYVIEAES